MCTKQYIHIGELLTCAVSVVIWGETDHGLATRLHVSEPGYDSGAMCPKMCVQDLTGPSSSMPLCKLDIYPHSQAFKLCVTVQQHFKLYVTVLQHIIRNLTWRFV